jgi:dynactin complex subunit
MRETNDPNEVFAQYSEGVTINEDKSITITLKVQRDILDATAMLMHEVNKLSSILGLFLTVVQRGNEEEIEKVGELAAAYLQSPEDVALIDASAPEQVAELISTITLAGLDEDDEVEN